MMAYTMRYQEELRKPAEYFRDIKKVKIDEDSLELAETLIKKRTAKFDPEQVRRRLRGRAQRTGRSQGQARCPSRGRARRAAPRQGHQPDGRAAQERAEHRDRPGCAKRKPSATKPLSSSPSTKRRPATLVKSSAKSASRAPPQSPPKATAKRKSA